MSVHVAILVSPYPRLILEGRKTVESRFSRLRREPFGAIRPGDRIYFKLSGGPFVATAVAERVWMADRITPEKMDRIRERHNEAICAPDAYWAGKRGETRFATLIWLRDAAPTRLAPRYRSQKMRAWYVLPDAADPMAELPADQRPEVIEIDLTAGALRQHYVRLGDELARFPAAAVGGKKKHDAGRPLTLHLADGPSIETDIVGPQSMLRYRGWATWFQQHELATGDRLRFVRRSRYEYDVRPIHNHGEDTE